jgi:ribose transport system ATP-binding protein
MDGIEDVLELRDIHKSYGPTRALRGVSMTLRRGEVHGFIGGNGSGKSTLVKILAGVETADRGEIQVGAQPFPAATMTPDQARSLGLRFVHQNPGLFQDLSVADNLSLGHGYETGVLGRIRTRAVNRRADELLRRYHLDIDSQAPIGSLSAASQTVVAIARAMQDLQDGTSGLLVLDEPTASLPKREADQLLTSIRRLASQGLTIVLISHRLDEILSVCDRVTALRDGELAGVYPAAELDEAALIRLIVGRDLDDAEPRATAVDENAVPAVQLEGVWAGPLHDIDLSVRPGEIVGIAGLLGSGRTTLLQTIFGERRPTEGTIRLGGKPVRFTTPAQAMAAGVGYVPEDRAAMAAFEEHSIADNIAVASMSDFWRGAGISGRRIRAEARRLVRDFGIRSHSVDQPLSTLSGGNQQKVVLARWLRRHPRVLLLDEPTQGVDVGARADIYELIGKALAAGAGVLVVASDMEELARICDRVLILRDGTLTETVPGPGIAPHDLNELIYRGKGAGHR